MSPSSICSACLQESELFSKLEAQIKRLTQAKPVTKRRKTVLEEYFAFETSEVMPHPSTPLLKWGVLDFHLAGDRGI